MQINYNNTLFSTAKPLIMGILNATSDSFFKASRTLSLKNQLKKIEKMQFEGADIIDIGGYSTRPQATAVSLAEELERITPLIYEATRAFPSLMFSIDTFRSEVAQCAADAGIGIVNDISGGNFDTDLWKVVAKNNLVYILTHIQGNPKTMQQNPQYEDIMLEINQYFSEKIAALQALNISDVILDPGFGFGKTIAHNYEILQNLNFLGLNTSPILVGISRKSMLYKVLEITPDEALNATTAIHMLGLLKKAKILRVHDVGEAVECVKLLKNIV